MMGGEIDLWDKFCGFYENSFERQLEYNREQLRSHLSTWGRTGTAAALGSSKAEDIAAIRLTDYSDYPFMMAFGQDMETRMRFKPRFVGESWFDYYKRVGTELAGSILPYLPEEQFYSMKTSGTTGKAKYIVQCGTFLDNYAQDLYSMTAIACSTSWGETTARIGDTILNVVAPVPYLSGYGFVLLSRLFKVLPSVKITDEVTDMRRKFYITLSEIEKGARVDMAGSVGSLFYQTCRYFSERDRLFEDYSESLGFGKSKLYMLLKVLQTKILGTKKENLNELLPLKGVAIVGVEAALYKPYIKEVFGLDVTNILASTEFGIAMLSHPEWKELLMPNLHNIHLEFINSEGEIKQIDELKLGEVYTLVGTPFGSPILRYNIGDKLRVAKFTDDHMPLFLFEGRDVDYIDFQNYFRINEHVAVEMMRRAGLMLSDRWAVAKLIDPEEHLVVLMERDWDHDNDTALKLFFDALLETSQGFRNYVRDFGVKDPSRVFRIVYVRKGAFLRYQLARTKSGAPLGQMKPPKIIEANRMEIFDMLRSI